MDVFACAVPRGVEGFSLELGLIGGSQVCAAAKQVGKILVQLVEDGSAGGPGGGGLVRCKQAVVLEQGLGQLLAVIGLPLGIQFRIGGLVGLEHGVVIRFLLFKAGQHGRKVLPHILRDLKGRSLPVIEFPHGGNVVRPQGFAMGGSLALLGGPVGNVGMDDDQGRGAGGFGLGDGRLNGCHVLAVGHLLHVPAVGFVTLLHILGEGDIRTAFDGDPVAIIEDDQLVELHHPCQGGGFRLDAFHHAAVPHEHVGIVIYHRIAFPVEDGSQMAFRHGHAHRHGDALAQGAGGSFHADGMAVFRMAGGLAAPLPEGLKILYAKGIAKQVEQGVFQHRGVARAQNEPVPRLPSRILGVMFHLLPDGIGHGRGADGHTGMAAVGFLHRVCRQHTNGGDGAGLGCHV